MKFLVDQNRSPRLAELLRIDGHDAIHTLELGLERAPDDELLALAASEERVIVSGDTDFGALLALRDRRSPSVVLFRSRRTLTADDQHDIIRVRVTRIVRPQGRAQVRPHFRWRRACTRRDGERNEATQGFDRRGSRSRLPLCPLLGNPLPGAHEAVTGPDPASDSIPDSFAAFVDTWQNDMSRHVVPWEVVVDTIEGAGFITESQRAVPYLYRWGLRESARPLESALIDEGLIKQVGIRWRGRRPAA